MRPSATSFGHPRVARPPARNKPPQTQIVPADDDAEADNEVYDQTPVRVVCHHCGHNVITFVEHESSWVTYSVAMFLLMVLNWAALIVVPVVYPLFKDVVHHCPRCLSVLAARSRVAVTGCKDEVMSFRLGSCVIVLARKYVMLLAAVGLIIGGIHYTRSSWVPPTGVDAAVRTTPAALDWADYAKDCGHKKYLDNPIHVKVAFEKSYKNKTFQWEGSVHHLELGFDFLVWSQRGALFMSMEPARSSLLFGANGFVPMARRQAPDLMLFYDDATLATDVQKLKRGQHIGIVATIVEVGKRGAPHVMKLWQLVNGTNNGTNGVR